MGLYLGKLDIIYNSSILVNPFKDKWEHNIGTNCYAYALGIDVAKDFLDTNEDRLVYNPGCFCDRDLKSPFTREQLLINLLGDLDRLGLYSYRVNTNYKLCKNEWKLVIYGAVTDNPYEYKDFHLLRQTIPDGVYSHKQGFYSEPTCLDSDKKIITDPSKCRIEDIDEGELYKYELLDTIVVSR